MDNLNLESLSFRNQMAQLISSSSLPACIIYYIIKDIYQNIEKQYENILLMQQQQLEAEENINDNEKIEE